MLFFLYSCLSYFPCVTETSRFFLPAILHTLIFIILVAVAQSYYILTEKWRSGRQIEMAGLPTPISCSSLPVFFMLLQELFSVTRQLVLTLQRATKHVLLTQTSVQPTDDAITAILAPEFTNMTRFDSNMRRGNPSSCLLSPGPPWDSASCSTPSLSRRLKRLRLDATPIPDRSAIPIRSPKRPDSSRCKVMRLGDSTRNAALARTDSKSVAHDHPIDSAPPRRTRMVTSRYPLGHRQDPESLQPISARDCDLPVGTRRTQSPRLPEDLDRRSATSGCPLWADVRSRLADATSNPDLL